MKTVGWLAWLMAALAVAFFLVAAPRAQDEPEVIAELRAQGAEIVELGRQGGLEGYFVKLPDGSVYTLYVTEEGFSVNGLLYAPDGGLLTGAQLEMARQLEGPGPVDPEKAALEQRFLESLQGHGFTVGGKGPVVVVFADPECRWSRLVVAELAERAMEGAMRVRVVPVALLGTESALRAMVVLSSEHPELEWFSPGVSVGGAPAGGERVMDNNRRFEAWGARAVPLTLYREKDGDIAAGVGDIVDMRAFVAGLYRPPEPRTGLGR